jgi:hypothetical protein
MVGRWQKLAPFFEVRGWKIILPLSKIHGLFTTRKR